jgi:hypothetical protein
MELQPEPEPEPTPFRVLPILKVIHPIVGYDDFLPHRLADEATHPRPDYIDE